MTSPGISSFLPALFILILQINPVSGVAVTHLNSRSAEPRPPLDSSLLAIQIGSIAASYVVFVAVILALVLFVGRRLRRTVQSSNYSLQMQMLNPAKHPESLDPSPITPITHNLPSPSRSSVFTSWGSIPRGVRPSHASMNGSMVTVDESVVASDRQKAEDEMERLYAAVMQHDAQKAAGVNVASVRSSDSHSHSPDSQYTNPFTDRAASQVSLGGPAAPPVPPKSPRHTTRLSKLFSPKAATPSDPDAGRLKSPRFPIRKLGISSPLPSPNVNMTQTYGQDQPPMSPRIYTPGPPPTAPRVGPPLAQAMSPRRARPPAPLTLSTTPSSSSPIQPKSSSLPFREAYPQQSAPATKTTFLERPAKKNGPITGMPTPYTPYMPFTPVTPFTPGRTVTRRQRKREEKTNGLRVLVEDDLVKDDNDMWG